MTVKISETKSYTLTERGWLWANSVDVTGWMNFVSITWNVVSKATSSTKIAWVSLTQKVFTSDNQTVAMNRLNFIPVECDVLYNVTITGWTITVADEGKFYNLTDSVTVDWTTESTVAKYTNTSDAGGATDPLITMQLELVTFVSATNSVFRIVL